MSQSSCIMHEKEHKKKRKAKNETEGGYETNQHVLLEDLTKNRRKTKAPSQEETTLASTSKVESQHQHAACVSQEECSAGSDARKRKRNQKKVDEIGSRREKRKQVSSIKTAPVSELALSQRKEKLHGARQTTENDLVDRVIGTTADDESPNKEEDEENEKSSVTKKKRRVTFGSVSIIGGGSEKTPNGVDQEQATPYDELEMPPVHSERLVSWKEDYDREDLVWAKRFTKEEDELLKKSIYDYIKSKGWAEAEGLAKVWNSKSSKEERGCWKEISRCLPHRSIISVVSRAHRLLDYGAHKGKWSEEEENLLRSLFTKYGHKWRKISSVIGRSSKNVKDKWRLMKLERSRGRWTQQELFKLCNMVHENLQLRAKLGKEKNRKDHRQLRDEINWQSISDRLGSRAHNLCATEWYQTLASSMVVEGKWATEDDRLLLLSLLESGADDEEAVEWNKLLEHRPGLICRKRWKQMVKLLGESSHISFNDKLKLLTQRYSPDLLEDQNED